jgi:hypothetical protein
VRRRSYEVKDNKYYPIFPKFMTSKCRQIHWRHDSDVVFQMWQARARKTPEMAEAYDQMNARIDAYVLQPSLILRVFPAGRDELPAGFEHHDQRQADQGDREGTDAEAALADIIAEWDKGGGLEQEEAINAWYAENFG